MNRVKNKGVAAGYAPTIFTAVLALAITFTLTACGGSKPPSPANGFEETSTPSSELRKKCLKDYKDFYCGIGDEVSSDEYAATTFAETKARANMSTAIASLVKRVAGISTGNTTDKDALAGATERIGEESKNDLVDVTVQETKVLYNKEEKKYHVYAMVTVSKKDFLEKLKARIGANQELAALAKTQQVIDAINKEAESTENFLDR
ncbi:MAG: hypothetical protein LBH25_13685 [Fibromonadaceae bacterium]|jgi:hypothetical protein|nr:hypothetical protein [Fibromonadaceae bacterium]